MRHGREFLFLVGAQAGWVAGLSTHDQVNASLIDDDDKVWVSVAGNPAAEAFFPDGVESPNLRVLCLRAATAEYWDAPSSRIKRLALMGGAILGNTEADLGESGTINLSQDV